MSKKKIEIRSIIADFLYFILNIIFSIKLDTTLPFWGVVIESLIETILFDIFMRWLIRTNKNSQKNTTNNKSNKSFLKYFLTGMLGGWIILTIMLSLQIGNQLNKAVVENIPLFIGVYLVIGIFSGLAMYLVYRVASKN